MKTIILIMMIMIVMKTLGAYEEDDEDDDNCDDVENTWGSSLREVGSPLGIKSPYPRCNPYLD